MDPLEDAFEKAVQNGVFPGAVLLAKDRSGMLSLPFCCSVLFQISRDRSPSGADDLS